MITKLTNYNLTERLGQKISLSSFPSGPESPFNNLLNQEMNTTAFLETSLLNYLIKTIELILSKSDQPDQWLPFPRIPFGAEDSLQPLPAPKNPIIETSSEVSAIKPKGQEIDEIIQGAADRYGVEPSLIKAVIAVESNGNPRAVSPAGAQGLMQLMPRTAAELGVTDPFDPKQNIQAGTRYLSRLMDRYQGNQKLALAAYNWGMGNLEKNPSGLPKETRDYIVRVERKFQTYQADSFPA